MAGVGEERDMIYMRNYNDRPMKQGQLNIVLNTKKKKKKKKSKQDDGAEIQSSQRIPELS